MSKKAIHFKVIQKSRIDALENQALEDNGRTITGGGCLGFTVIPCPTLGTGCPRDLPCADLVCGNFMCADLICIDHHLCTTYCGIVMCGDDPKPDPQVI